VTVKTVLNISCYKFITLDDLTGRQARYLEKAHTLQLKGTILLSEEGINFFLAGSANEVREFVEFLKEDPQLQDLTPKESWSSTQPFRKMLVKIKREIIRMNHPTIKPENARAPSVSAHQLRTWLREGKDDEGREVITLDTRNDYEVLDGKFKDAVEYNIAHFGQFPAKVKENMDALKGKTIVSYCTGGIRCEKAAIYLREIGLEHVYQLEGGILKYFEEVGSEHYEGTCFVFDDRRAVTASLEPANELGNEPVGKTAHELANEASTETAKK